MTLSNSTHPDCHRSLVFAIAALLAVALDDPSRADDSLARFVPAEVGLYAEVRGSGDLLSALTDPQIWTTLAELAGQPAEPQDVAKWRQRIRQTVGMSPDEAIHVLFAQGAAFVGEGAGRSQDAVVVCRPAKDHPIKELLERWNATRRPQPTRPRTYQLYSNIGVAEHDGLLFFGDLLPTEGLFRRVQQFIAEPQPRSLAEDPVYKVLLARVPQRPDGILFARLTEAAPLLVPTAPPGSQPATQPSVRAIWPNLPGPLRNARNVLFALHRAGPLLHFTAVGDAKAARTTPPAGPLDMIDKLPERVLAAWEGRVDFSRLAGVVERLPAQSPVRSVLKMQEQIESLNRFFSALDTDTCLAVGPVYPKNRSPSAPPLPALALLVQTRDPALVADELRNVVELCRASYALVALAQGVPPLPTVRAALLDKSVGLVLDLSPLLKPTARKAFGEVHFCWAVQEETLIIASHEDWLREIVSARSGRAPSLAGVLQLSPVRLTPTSGNAIVMQTGPISDIGRLWREYLKRAKPEVFDEKWWRDRQPGGGDVRLGVNVTPDLPNRRLRIDQVFQNQPADGHLRIGDYIVGYDNRRFATDDLAAEIRDAIRNRPHARWLELLIERDGATVQKRLPLPFIDPLDMLQRLIAVGKITQRAVYHDDRTNANGSRGFLTIELRTSEKPLFDFSPTDSAQPMSRSGE